MSTQSVKELSRSRALAAKTIYATFKLIKEAGGELPLRTIYQEIPTRVVLNEWEGGTLEKTGWIRWRSNLQFYSIDCVKAGFLIKQSGVWILTEEGEAVLEKGERGLLEAAIRGYHIWKTKNVTLSDDEKISDEPESEESDKTPLIVFEQMESQSREGLKNYIDQMNPYAVQDIVAAVLRGMSYFTPFVAPRGKDGGIDITAYKDPLGTVSPRVKVQVKHRNDPAAPAAIRQLIGVLQKTDDVGIFVSTGGFTNDARAEARNSHNRHVELIDLDKLIDLWQEYYPNLSDDDKALLPLKAVYFLAPKK